MFGSAIQTGSKNLPMILFGRFAGGCNGCSEYELDIFFC